MGEAGKIHACAKRDVEFCLGASPCVVAEKTATMGNGEPWGALRCHESYEKVLKVCRRKRARRAASLRRREKSAPQPWVPQHALVSGTGCMRMPAEMTTGHTMSKRYDNCSDRYDNCSDTKCEKYYLLIY